MENVLTRPFLKWAGNKFTLLDRIRRLLPQGARLIEPFAGSCAVFLNTDYATSLLADSNADLINLYRHVKSEGQPFIDYCTGLFSPEANSHDVYYASRDEFNHTRDLRRKAALFLYLNRHGYNGLCRYNGKGGYNVPMGRYKKPYFPAAEMHAFHAKAQKAEFIAADFRQVMLQARPGDVIYCDPPYVPLSRTANFTAYGAAGFGPNEQSQLATLAEKLSESGIPVVISNHDTAFTHGVYGKAQIRRFEVQRFISSKGAGRNKAAELLAFYRAAA